MISEFENVKINRKGNGQNHLTGQVNDTGFHSKSQVANIRPTGHIRPSILFLPGDSAKLLSPS